MIRIAVLAVLVAAAAAACGSDQDPTLAGEVPGSSSSSSSPSSSSGSSTTASSGPRATVAPPDAAACTGAEPGDGSDLTMDVDHGTLRSGAAVTWRLTVTNGGGDDVELVFGSGQDGDVTLSRDGTEVYRWSSDMVFTQAVRCQLLPAGATATYDLPQPVLDVAPGEYQLRASLASQPQPFDVATQVSVA